MSVVISARIPKELKEKARKYGINISEFIRRSLEEEIRRRELEEITRKLKKFRDKFRHVDVDDVVKVVREIREER